MADHNCFVIYILKWGFYYHLVSSGMYETQVKYSNRCHNFGNKVKYVNERLECLWCDMFWIVRIWVLIVLPFAARLAMVLSAWIGRTRLFCVRVEELYQLISNYSYMYVQCQLQCLQKWANVLFLPVKTKSRTHLKIHNTFWTHGMRLSSDILSVNQAMKTSYRAHLYSEGGNK